MRLRSDIWVSAYRRRCESAGAIAVQRRKGAAEAGAIFIKVDHLDGHATLIGPAPQTSYDEGETTRRFMLLHQTPAIATGDAEAQLARQIRFDPDLWIVEVEDRHGRSFLLDDELQAAGER